MLVGDHNQLPPLVVNAEAKRAGLGCSLFRSLSEAHPQVRGGLSPRRCIPQQLCLLSGATTII